MTTMDETITLHRNRIAHIQNLIQKALDDIENDRKGNARGKLSAALGNLDILTCELHELKWINPPPQSKLTAKKENHD